MVDRYRPTVADMKATAYCGPHPDGEYVKVSDYDALAARLAEMRQAMDELHIKHGRSMRRLAEAEQRLLEFIEYVEQDTEWPDLVAEGRAFLRPADSAPAVEPLPTRCSDHPDAPHGFDRNASHSADRYVCRCEGWAPDSAPAQESESHD